MYVYMYVYICREGAHGGEDGERHPRATRLFLPAPPHYRGTSFIRNSAPLGLYSRTWPRALCWSWGGAVSYE